MSCHHPDNLLPLLKVICFEYLQRSFVAPALEGLQGRETPFKPFSGSLAGGPCAFCCGAAAARSGMLLGLSREPRGTVP